MANRRTVLQWTFWTLLTVGGILLAVIAWVALPILTHQSQGTASQSAIPEGEYVSWVDSTGEDGRARTLSLFDETGTSPLVPNRLEPGQRVVVRGTGYDSSQGIYVAVCKISDDPTEKPTPCLGGVPETEEAESPQGDTVTWGPSAWINSDWAWRIAGARDFDDPSTGSFTAYLEIPAADENLDCTVERCAVYTRNDHTASDDRVQDVHIPIRFGPVEAIERD